jgi:hypothetical protein
MVEEKDLSSASGDLPKSEVCQIEKQIGETQVIMDSEVDVHLSKKLDKKFDLHIVPWIFGIW